MSDVTSQLRDKFRNGNVELSDITGNLVSAAHGQGISSIYITSAHHGEGKTTMAMGVAYGLQLAAPHQVALIEASVCSSSFQSIFDLPTGAAGLYDYLVGDAGVDEISRSMEGDELAIIPAGTQKSQDIWLEAYEDEKYLERLKKLKDHFMYAVFDGDSVLPVTGSTMAVSQFEAVILTVACGETKWQVASLARDKLVGYGGNILGVALNKRQYPIPRAIYSRV